MLIHEFPWFPAPMVTTMRPSDDEQIRQLHDGRPLDRMLDKICLPVPEMPIAMHSGAWFRPGRKERIPRCFFVTEQSEVSPDAPLFCWQSNSTTVKWIQESFSEVLWSKCFLLVILHEVLWKEKGHAEVAAEPSDRSMGRDLSMCPRRQQILPVLGPVGLVVVVAHRELPSRSRSLGGGTEEPLVVVSFFVVPPQFGVRGHPGWQLSYPSNGQ